MSCRTKKHPHDTLKIIYTYNAIISTKTSGMTLNGHRKLDRYLRERKH